MNRSSSHPTVADISRAASDWLVRRDAGFNADEQAEFNEWLRADPRHASAMAEAEAAWSAIQRPRHTGDVDFAMRVLESRRQRRVRRRIMTAGVSVAAAAVIAVIFRLTSFQPSIVPADSLAATMIARPERRALADGSVVELNAGAEIVVDFSPEHRRVRLIRGDAHFTVAKDASRPFLVGAGTVEVRAIGTVFAVQLGADAVEVLVTEGKVQVNKVADEPGPGAPLPAIADLPSDGAGSLVTAGERTIVSITADASIAAHVEPVSALEIENALAWRTRRIEFSGTPLAEALAMFNRQNRTQLALGNPALAKHEIGGIFWIDNPEGFARLLETSFGVQAVRERDDTIVLHRLKR
jgi:transmembrane sensor